LPDNITKHPAPNSLSSGISLAMIVNDGGKFLAPLLEEAKLWVDEIIIGDTGSTDGSQEVAIASGAKVLDITWQDDFSTARNEVQRACSGHWVLSLDADDLISSSDWQALVDFATDHHNLQQPVATTLLTRKYLASGVYKRGKVAVPNNDPHQVFENPISAGFIPSQRVRLFPNLKFVEFRGILHENVEASLREACIPIIELPVVVHHLGSLTAKPHKDASTFKLALAKTRHQPHDAKAWAELSAVAIDCGDLPEALAAIDRALILNPGNAGNRLTLGWLLKKNGQLDTADMQLAAVAGLAGVSDLELADASHLRAQIAMVQRRKEDVISLLGMALRLDPDNGFFQNTLGMWLLSQGKSEDARRVLECARQAIPLEVGPWLNLGLLYEELDQPEPALQHLQQAFALQENNARVNAAIGRVTMMLEREASKKNEPCPTN
jgi:Tfp pilus assembly protein PilF